MLQRRSLPGNNRCFSLSATSIYPIKITSLLTQENQRRETAERVSPVGLHSRRASEAPFVRLTSGEKNQDMQSCLLEMQIHCSDLITHCVVFSNMASVLVLVMEATESAQ